MVGNLIISYVAKKSKIFSSDSLPIVREVLSVITILQMVKYYKIY